MKCYCLLKIGPDTSFYEGDCADVSFLDYFWFPGNIASAVPSILGLSEPPAFYQSFHYFGSTSCFTLPGTEFGLAQSLSHCKVNIGQQPNNCTYSTVPTSLKLLLLPAILKAQVNIHVFSCCSAAGFKMALHHPFPRHLSTMCDRLIRN